MTDAATLLAQAGFQNAQALVSAAVDTGLPFHVAAAMIAKETMGSNVYGHDSGGTMYGAGQVTEDNFKNQFLPAILAGAKSNGVGPSQITYPAYFRQNQSYAWWEPYQNMKFGFNLIKNSCRGDYSHNHLIAVGSTYNSGNATGNLKYGNEFANFAAKYATLLSGSTQASSMSVPKEEPFVEDYVYVLTNSARGIRVIYGGEYVQLHSDEYVNVVNSKLGDSAKYVSCNEREFDILSAVLTQGETDASVDITPIVAAIQSAGQSQGIAEDSIGKIIDKVSEKVQETT